MCWRCVSHWEKTRSIRCYFVYGSRPSFYFNQVLNYFKFIGFSAVEHSGHLKLVVYGTVSLWMSNPHPLSPPLRFQMFFFPGKKTTSRFAAESFVRNFNEILRKRACLPKFSNKKVLILYRFWREFTKLMILKAWREQNPKLSLLWEVVEVY